MAVKKQNLSKKKRANRLSSNFSLKIPLNKIPLLGNILL